MGVSRNITIRVYTKLESSFTLIKNFLCGFWIKENSSFINMFYNDESDNDVLPYQIRFSEIETLFTKRANKLKINTISFSVNELNEVIILSIKRIKNHFNDDKTYEIWISPGGAHTLKEHNRNTDFSFYLNQILPRLEAIGCQITKINCCDYE